MSDPPPSTYQLLQILADCRAEGRDADAARVLGEIGSDVEHVGQRWFRVTGDGDRFRAIESDSFVLPSGTAPLEVSGPCPLCGEHRVVVATYGGARPRQWTCTRLSRIARARRHVVREGRVRGVRPVFRGEDLRWRKEHRGEQWALLGAVGDGV